MRPVVVAHVDSASHGPDVFGRPREPRPGHQVTVRCPDTASPFAVTERAAETDLPTDRISSRTTDPVLRMTTCRGAFDRTARGCLDNIVVYADRLV